MNFFYCTIRGLQYSCEKHPFCPTTEKIPDNLTTNEFLDLWTYYTRLGFFPNDILYSKKQLKITFNQKVL